MKTNAAGALVLSCLLSLGLASPGWAQSLAAAVLPSSRSAQVGSPVTAFATIINLGPGTATGCSIAPKTIISASFVYQTTDPTTNALTGTANTAVNIPPGANQSFVIAFTSSSPFAPTDVQLTFACTNTAPAPSTTGLNTLLLSASAAPVPDVIALAATPTNDGIVNLAKVGVFALATVNAGAAGQIAVAADTGAVTLPIGLALCQTNPTTGACVAPPTPTVTTQVDAQATLTFSIFVTENGPIAFDPANNRIFVRFRDSGGNVRGTTSVAVRTLSGGATALAQLVATRSSLSFGRDDSVRLAGVSNGLTATPLNPASGTPAGTALAPRVITLGDDGHGSPDPNNAIVKAANGIPSCCTLLVAEGAVVHPGLGGIPHFHWEVVPGLFKGTYYSTGTEGSGGFPFGAEITDLSVYDRNSVFLEMPSIGFPILRHDAPGMGGHTSPGVHVHSAPPPFSETPPPPADDPTISSSRFVALEWGQGQHLELQPVCMDPHDDGFALHMTANVVGNFFPSGQAALLPLTTFRWEYFGATRNIVGDVIGTNTVVFLIPKTELTTQAHVQAVASGPASVDPFIEPRPIALVNTLTGPDPNSGLDTWRSRECTIGDTLDFLVVQGAGPWNVTGKLPPCSGPCNQVIRGEQLGGLQDLTSRVHYALDGVDVGTTAAVGPTDFIVSLTSGTHQLCLTVPFLHEAGAVQGESIDICPNANCKEAVAPPPACPVLAPPTSFVGVKFVMGNISTNSTSVRIATGEETCLVLQVP